MRLRPIEPEDLDLLYSIENDPSLWHVSNPEAPYSRYQLKQYLAHRQSIFACGELRLVIEVTDDEHSAPTAIGLLDLTNFSPTASRAEIGIALLKAYRGRNLSTKALNLCEQLFVERLRIHQLYAYIPTFNAPSLATFSRAGYRQVAILADWVYADGRYHDAALLCKVF